MNDRADCTCALPTKPPEEHYAGCPVRRRWRTDCAEAECAAMRVSFQRLVHLMRTNSVSGAFREWSEQSTPEAIRDAGKALLDELTALRSETRFSGPRCEWCGERPPCDPKGCPGPPGRKRWGIVQVDPSPSGVTIWVEPRKGEDQTQDPDEVCGEAWTPVFMTPAEAAHAITQRPRYEVRELPTRGTDRR